VLAIGQLVPPVLPPQGFASEDLLMLARVSPGEAGAAKSVAAVTCSMM
jgi:hypothetical protein